MVRALAIAVCLILAGWEVWQGSRILTGGRKRLAQRGGRPAVVLTRSNRRIYGLAQFAFAALLIVAALYNLLR